MAGEQSTAIAMERERNGDGDNDQISNLPEFLHHQILSYLPPKEAARTTVLSQTWLQSYSSSPFLTFDECFFCSRSPKNIENRYPFFNFINNTLLRYTRLNLRIHKFKITVCHVDHPPAYHLLDKSLGVAFDNGVKELHISVLETKVGCSRYTLPSPMFHSPKLLTYLKVNHCKFPPKLVSNSKCSAILFPFLKTLHIYHSHINDGMLQKLLSSCPSLEQIVFFGVYGFKKFLVCNLGKLEILDIRSVNMIEIDIEDAPSLHLLEYHRFSRRPCLLKVGRDLQNLKRLVLYSVSINDNSLKELITKFPLLEDLRIETCDELKKINILSSSLKHLYFCRCKMLVKAIIEAPNLLKLVFVSQDMLSLYLNDTRDELMTRISIDHSGLPRLTNAWFKRLSGLLKGVNQATYSFRFWHPHQGIQFGIEHNSRENPLPLEHQTMNYMPHINQSSSLFAVFVETLFSSSHPTSIGVFMISPSCIEFIKFLSCELMRATKNANCCSSDRIKCWRHYLKDIEVEVYEKAQEVWKPLPQETSLSESLFLSKKIRFNLKWYANLNAQVL